MYNANPDLTAELENAPIDPPGFFRTVPESLWDASQTLAAADYFSLLSRERERVAWRGAQPPPAP
jgi:hypothetical protein